MKHGFPNLADARLRLVQARETLTQLKVEQEAAERVLAQTLAEILVPPGAMVWSLISSQARPATRSPIASWVDCKVMLIDAPISDVEAALLKKGSLAHVVLEGDERFYRQRAADSRSAERWATMTVPPSPRAGGLASRSVGEARAFSRRHKHAAIGHAAYVDFRDWHLRPVARTASTGRPSR